jgi:hypothetical protein
MKVMGTWRNAPITFYYSIPVHGLLDLLQLLSRTTEVIILPTTHQGYYAPSQILL